MAEEGVVVVMDNSDNFGCHGHTHERGPGRGFWKPKSKSKSKAKWKWKAKRRFHPQSLASSGFSPQGPGGNTATTPLNVR